MTQPYVLVHLVAQEVTKDLIGPQVIDHAATQALASGPNAPAHVMAAFLEPLRAAISPRVRRAIRSLRARDRSVHVITLPYVSRVPRRHNARIHALRLAMLTGRLPVVFHCRTESATDWALSIAAHLGPCGIITDVRGAWPMELIFSRGFDSPETADEASRHAYNAALDHLQRMIAASHSVLSVSPRMIEWLTSIGTPREKLVYVPCCVRGVTFDEQARQRVRGVLGLGERLVLCYMGTITRYQHVGDGVLPFFRTAAAQQDDVHLLLLTPQVAQMRQLVEEAGVASDRVTIVSASQAEVKEYLSAADAGFLLRAPTKLNDFSQPTKLGEYLAAGVPVLVSRGTGTVDTLIESARAGKAVTAFYLSESELAEEANATCQALRTCGEEWRRNALALCKSHFTWSTYASEVRDAYIRALDLATSSSSLN